MWCWFPDIKSLVHDTILYYIFRALWKKHRGHGMNGALVLDTSEHEPTDSHSKWLIINDLRPRLRHSECKNFVRPVP